MNQTKYINAFLQKPGGNALSSVGVTRINKEDVRPTIEFVSRISGIPTKGLHLLGSTGKSSSSGDIDVGISISEFDPYSVHSKMIEVLGSENTVFNKGLGIGSYAVPISGEIGTGLVQVDFMFVPNTEWAEFSYFSTGGQHTKYKGVVRTILLRSIASTLNEEGVDLFVYDSVSRDLTVRVGRTFDMNIGLRRIIQVRPMKKRGGGYLSSMKPVSMDELDSLYPELDVCKLKTFNTIDDPTEVLRVLFNDNIRPVNVETAEQIVNMITEFPTERKEQIIITANRHLSQSAHFTSDQLFDLWSE